MAGKAGLQRVFDTDRRIRMGIWGLGRGMSFFNTCKTLNIDVVAGCDFNEHMRDNFLVQNPGAFVTADAEEFLAQDFDAVLLATFCPAHGPHAIKCLRAGKHVLSEVTAFFSLAEGVQLVEEVRKRKLVYNLAENYPFTAANMWLANRWREGLFGDLMYAEYEYIHECRSLAYTYIDGKPVEPGHTVHNWRSWFNFHYYCTHSLGPVMVNTGTRPVMVEAFPCRPRIAGYLRGQGADNGTMTPSLIQMDNGSVVRNLMGAATHDAHHQRVWGTRGAYGIGSDGVQLSLGAAGHAPTLSVKPEWEGLGRLAAEAGHGGGDFWTLYYFAREILTGEKGPFDIYSSCDVTIPGIQALRSSHEGGRPMEVPDFRRKADRERYRSDDWQQERYDTARGVFGGVVPTGKAADFSSLMKDIVRYVPVYRAYADWRKVQGALVDPAAFLPLVRGLLNVYEDLARTYRDALAVVRKYPDSDGAGVLREMLELGDHKLVLAAGFLPALKKEVGALMRKFGDIELAFTASALLPIRGDIARVALPGDEVTFTPVSCHENGFVDIRDRYAGRAKGKASDGLVYLRSTYRSRKAARGRLRIGADGPFRVFVNGDVAGGHAKATNPITAHQQDCDVLWRKGNNEIVVAVRTNGGKAWGMMGRLLNFARL